MKTIKVHIDIYDWNIYYLEIVGKENTKKIKQYLLRVRTSNKLRDEIIKDMEDKAQNGGNHLYNTFTRTSMILVYNPKNIKTKVDIICHEICHVVDKIMDHLELESSEAGAFLTGYISKKILPEALKL